MLKRSMTDVEFIEAMPDMKVSEMALAVRGMSRADFRRVIKLMEIHERQQPPEEGQPK